MNHAFKRILLLIILDYSLKPVACCPVNLRILLDLEPVILQYLPLYTFLLLILFWEYFHKDHYWAVWLIRSFYNPGNR